jgi:hypothetical protein
MNSVDHPFESISIGREWMNILQESGVSVLEYLRIEHRLHYDPVESLPMMQRHPNTDYRLRYLVIFEEPPSISWDWFIDPAGKAFDVLETFKNFGPASHDMKAFLNNSDFAHNWPFYPLWIFVADLWEQGLLYGASMDMELVIEAARRAHARFDRRWQKKARKIAKAQGILYQPPRIPGAWID